MGHADKRLASLDRCLRERLSRRVLCASGLMFNFYVEVALLPPFSGLARVHGCNEDGNRATAQLSSRDPSRLPRCHRFHRNRPHVCPAFRPNLLRVSCWLFSSATGYSDLRFRTSSGLFANDYSVSTSRAFEIHNSLMVSTTRPAMNSPSVASGPISIKSTGKAIFNGRNTRRADT